MAKISSRSWMGWVTYALGFIALLGCVLAFLQWQSTTFPNNAFGIDLIFRGFGVLLLLGYIRGPQLWQAYQREAKKAVKPVGQPVQRTASTPPPLPVKSR